VVRQVQTPPSGVVEAGLRVRDVAADFAFGPARLRAARDELVAGGADPGLDLVVGQTAFGARRVALLKTPVGVERNPLALDGRHAGWGRLNRQRRGKSGDDETEQGRARGVEVSCAKKKEVGSGRHMFPPKNDARPRPTA